jgi:hypothetical protein
MPIVTAARSGPRITIGVRKEWRLKSPITRKRENETTETE